MKIQLLSLAAASTLLSVAIPAAAQTAINTNVAPVLQKQINTAIKAKGFDQGGDQKAILKPSQISTITQPAMPANIAKTKGPSSSAYAPAVIVNTNVTPLIQLQVNTAVLSKDGNQGGSQLGVVKPYQSGTTVGKGADGSYIYNTNYSPVYQYQFNNAYGSKGVTQGGSSTAILKPTQIGEIK